MNSKHILKHTASYEDELIEDLKDLEEAKYYLEATLEAYEADGDTNALILALGHVAKAQGGVGKLAKRTGISHQHLYDILASKHNPQLDNLLNILSGLGFRVRLECQDVATEQTAATVP